MFEEEHKLINQYFDYIKKIYNQDVSIMYGMYEDEGNLEIDGIIGDEDDKMLGLRFFDMKKEVIYDLLLEINSTKPPEKKGKKAFSFHYKSEDFNIDHDFVFYSETGKGAKGITYAEMVKKDKKGEIITSIFTLNKDLFEMQVQA